MWKGSWRTQIWKGGFQVRIVKANVKAMSWQPVTWEPVVRWPAGLCFPSGELALSDSCTEEYMEIEEKRFGAEF